MDFSQNPTRINKMAVLSLAFSVLPYISIFHFFALSKQSSIPWPNLLIIVLSPFIAIVSGITALYLIKKRQQRGKRLALWGIMLSILLFIIVLFILVVGAAYRGFGVR